MRSAVLADSSVNACVVELKTRARLGLSALAAGDSTLLERPQSAGRLKMPAPEQWQLRHALTLMRTTRRRGRLPKVDAGHRSSKLTRSRQLSYLVAHQ